MNNPLLILQTLDRHLNHPVELTHYGRAALALGFSSPESRHETTQDVIEFLLKKSPVTEAELRTAFEHVRVPDLQELRDAFRAAQPKVLAMAAA